MARIAGVTLPAHKKIDIGLLAIYGIGRTTAKKILAESSVSPDVRVEDLTEAQTIKLRDVVEKGFKVEGELRRDVMSHIKRLKEIGSYRGTRHSKSLPVRGQRTKTNSRTIRGNVRRTMGSGKRKLDKT